MCTPIELEVWIKVVGLILLMILLCVMGIL
jgi:hypothetical protein